MCTHIPYDACRGWMDLNVYYIYAGSASVHGEGAGVVVAGNLIIWESHLDHFPIVLV